MTSRSHFNFSSTMARKPYYARENNQVKKDGIVESVMKAQRANQNIMVKNDSSMQNNQKNPVASLYQSRMQIMPGNQPLMTAPFVKNPAAFGIPPNVLYFANQNLYPLSNTLKAKNNVFKDPLPHMDNHSNHMTFLQAKLLVGTADTRGLRVTMEDEFILYDGPKMLVLAVADGHGSGNISAWLKSHMGMLLHHFVIDNHMTIAQAFSEIQLQLTKDLGSFLVENAGSTLCSFILMKDTLVWYIANVGDSRAVHVNLTERKAQRITVDHKPEEEHEKARILKHGGTVTNLDVARLNGFLSLSRAFGDNYLRNSGLTEIPDVFGPFSLQQTYHHCIVLACDGLFDVVTDEMVGIICKKNIVTENVVGKSLHVKKAAEQLRNCAFDLQSKDNISCLVILINK